ncbi:MFS transporter [Escherichia coli]|nr:MFS transporter [Escherichia coli]
MTVKNQYRVERLPIAALLALAATGFLALLTETIPAGMLFQISADMQISESMAGQFVTLYAVGSVVAAVPLTVATQRLSRRTLLLAVLGSLFILNALTALTASYSFVLTLRFLAGMAGGLLWGMLAGYARRLASPSQKGRAVAIAGIGVPLALALGVPLGAYLVGLFGWRLVFGLVSLLSLGVMAWVFRSAPPPQTTPSAGMRLTLLSVLTRPGVLVILLVQLLWVVAHTILYTYIMPFLDPIGMADEAGNVLLLFGLASVAGIWLTGTMIDQMLRSLVLLSLAGFAVASLTLGLAGQYPNLIYLAIALWGLTFGGAPALLQTASAEAAGAGADVAQSLMTTVWNLAVAVGGSVGAVMLKAYGAVSLPWTLLVLLLVALTIVWKSRRHGFPVPEEY